MRIIARFSLAMYLKQIDCASAYCVAMHVCSHTDSYTVVI